MTVRNQAARMPNATNTPNTWTGGIGVNASEANPAADVSEVKSIGLYSVPMTSWIVLRRSLISG